ncbi:MAG: hypothetical protein H6842_06845 [Rhodospirillaceae bacterium]|nr:hypothetical protein [Rhodospirillaceae bacterium]
MSPSPPATVRQLSPAARRLARLVPGVYLARDEALADRPLLRLLEVLAAPLEDLDRAIDRLRDDHFAERASAEALPLLAELVGARLLSGDTRTSRAVVARTLHWRKRDGTLATLEDALSLTTGWPTEVEEAFRSILHTQSLRYPVPWRGRTAVLWDPIALADPLSRRAPQAERPRGGVPRRGEPVAREPGETVADALRRLGRADAGRHAASPRTIDFAGWARPEIAVIRTSRIVPAIVDRLAVAGVVDIPHATDPAVAFVGCRLDPFGRDLPLAAGLPAAPAAALGALTAIHEPPCRAAGGPVRHGLLTPTALAADGDAVEAADTVSLHVDGVQVVGPPLPDLGRGDLGFRPVGTGGVLRFADAGRPSPGEAWDLQLIAIDNPATIAGTVATPAGTLGTPPDADNPAVTATVARRGGRDAETYGAAAPLARGGATMALRIARRLPVTGYRRAADGTWTALPVEIRRGTPLSPLVPLDVGGPLVLARAERRPEGDLGIATIRPDGGPAWDLHPVGLAGLAPDALPALAAEKDGPFLAAAALGDALLLAGPIDGSDRLGVWRIDGAATDTPVAVRVDQPGPRRPPARLAPAACLHGGELFVHGGEQGAALFDDVWSLPLAGTDAGRWRPRPIRQGRRRTGGRLLSTPAGLMLLGGAESPGQLATTVWLSDPDQVRAGWSALPELPVAPGAPGVLWARVDGDAVEVLAWADRTRPQRLRLPAGATAWDADAADGDAAPNPPAEGDGLFAGDAFLAIGPTPLPPSEVVFTLSGDGHIAFLPALDLSAAGDIAIFFVKADGSTARWFPAGTAAQRSLRLGAGREAPVLGRDAPARRIGVRGRLGWQPLRLRQRSLGPWDRPLALDLDDIVALDPRLGRMAMRAELGQGRLEVLYRIARAAALGAGFLPSDRTIPEAWTEPEDADDPHRFAVPAPPDVDRDRLLGEAPVTARIAPKLAGVAASPGVPVVTTLGEGVREGVAEHVLRIAGSPRLAAGQLTIGQGHVLSLSPDGANDHPVVAADADGIALSLHERLAEGADPDLGPAFFLGGLVLTGTLQVALSAGAVDLRWCTLAQPGQAAVVVAGAGHQTPLARQTLIPPRLVLRLYGCLVGRLEVPPWVQVVAAGCTFDAGAPDLPAIAAGGARLRLRHCTIHGETQAGVVEASSCAFKGRTVCDRQDLSWARYSLLAESGRPPLMYESRIHPVSFASIDPARPDYLALADNNGAAALAAGERRRRPGAHWDTAQRMTELAERTEEFLPIAMVPWHVDRSTHDLNRMQGRSR